MVVREFSGNSYSFDNQKIMCVMGLNQSYVAQTFGNKTGQNSYFFLPQTKDALN
jgi:hypothetical protein